MQSEEKKNDAAGLQQSRTDVAKPPADRMMRSPQPRELPSATTEQILNGRRRKDQPERFHIR